MLRTLNKMHIAKTHDIPRCPFYSGKHTNGILKYYSLVISRVYLQMKMNLKNRIVVGGATTCNTRCQAPTMSVIILVHIQQSISAII